MKLTYVLLPALALLSVTKAFGQHPPDSMGQSLKKETVKSEDYATPAEEVLTLVEEMPKYPGGDQAMMLFLQKNIVYPDSARVHGIEGKVFVRFIVSADGVVRDAEIVRGVDPYLNAEALRVVNMMPAWRPGKQNGKNVNVLFTLPISFRLE